MKKWLGMNKVWVRDDKGQPVGQKRQVIFKRISVLRPGFHMHVFWFRIVNQELKKKKNTTSRIKETQPNQPFNISHLINSSKTIYQKSSCITHKKFK